MGELSALEGMLSSYSKETGLKYSLSSFHDAESYLASGDSYDAVFFDIELPGINGMELSRKIREKGDGTFIIFITHMAQFAIEGYSVSALDFVLKPLSYPQFSLKMAKLLRALENRTPADITIKIKYGPTSMFLQEKEIAYLDVRGHSLTYHCLSSDYQVRSSMVEESSKLSKLFAHCSDSFLVNLSYVRRIEKNSVIVSYSGKEESLPLTRKYKDSFKKEYLSHLEGEA